MHRRQFAASLAGTLAGGRLATCAPAGAAAPGAGDGPFDTAAFHAARRYVATPAGRIALVERGRGAAALFVHGFPLNGYQWRGALERLAPHRRCLAPDLLGMGYTQVADGASVAPDAQVAMLVALLDALGIGSVDLVANDSGGAVAQLLLVRHPARVRTLLLTNCDAEPDSPPPALAPVIALARQGEFARQWLAPWVADKALARSPQGLGGLTYTHPERLADETIDYYLAPLVASPRRQALTNAYAVALEPNPLAGIAPLLGRATAPVRIVWGTGDTVFSPESAAWLARHVGNPAGVRRVEGAKLFFPEEYPALIAEEALALWR